MFNSKRIKELEKKIATLEEKTIGKQEKEDTDGCLEPFYRSAIRSFFWSAIKLPSLKERIDKMEEKLDALIDYLKLESKTVTTEASEKCKIVKKETKKK